MCILLPSLPHDAGTALPFGWAVVKRKVKCAFNVDTVDAIRTLAGKSKGFDRPESVPRSFTLPRPDGRGLPRQAKLDGTNITESLFNLAETTMSAPTYKLDHAHALLMARASAVSYKGEIETLGRTDIGHSDLQLAREANDICRWSSLELQYPDVPPLPVRHPTTPPTTLF